MTEQSNREERERVMNQHARGYDQLNNSPVSVFEDTPGMLRIFFFAVFSSNALFISHFISPRCVCVFLVGLPEADGDLQSSLSHAARPRAEALRRV